MRRSLWAISGSGPLDADTAGSGYAGNSAGEEGGNMSTVSINGSWGNYKADVQTHARAPMHKPLVRKRPQDLDQEGPPAFYHLFNIY